MGTVEELRKEAAEIGIAGSPSMRKNELEVAIESAKVADAQVRAEAATERDIDGRIDLSRHVTAGAEETDPEVEGGGPFRAPKPPTKGATVFVYNDMPYEPVACGEHRSPAVGEKPHGFDPKCEACGEQWRIVVEHIRRVA